MKYQHIAAPAGKLHLLIFQQPQLRLQAVNDSKLSRRERQVMDVLYRLGKGTPEQILAELPDPPTNSAIRSTLRILLDKGRLKHTQAGRAYIYRPTTTARSARRQALRRVVDTFFEGSAGRAAASLIQDAGDLSDEEVLVLERLIERAREEEG